MVANFPNPNTGDGLMTFDEVETLFHEFGHVLHNGIGKSKYTRFVGANCEWDFVEAPSQIMEHWVWKVECLKRISKHIETSEEPFLFNLLFMLPITSLSSRYIFIFVKV